MKKKQLLGILLAGTMMVGAAVPVFAADGDRVKITYAQWGNETETAATQAVADKFNSEQDKIEVEVVKIDHDTYVTKLNAMATAGELPDTGIMKSVSHPEICCLFIRMECRKQRTHRRSFTGQTGWWRH